MAMLFGSIIMIQILAHLPLAEMAKIPASALESFEIMQSVVSFDYFQPTSYIEVDFTEMDPWTENFAELGYDSINFVEGMGSIIIFCSWQVIYAIITILFYVMNCNRCCCNKAKSYFTKR